MPREERTDDEERRSNGARGIRSREGRTDRNVSELAALRCIVLAILSKPMNDLGITVLQILEFVGRRKITFTGDEYESILEMRVDLVEELLDGPLANVDNATVG